MSIHEKLAQVEKTGKSLTPRLAIRDKIDELKRLCAEAGESEINSARKLITVLGIPELLIEAIDLFPEGTTVSFSEDQNVVIVFKWDYRNDKKLLNADGTLDGLDNSFNWLVLKVFMGEIYVETARVIKHVRFYTHNPLSSYLGEQKNYFSVTLKNEVELTKERVEASLVDALFKAGIRVPQPEKTKSKPEAENPTNELEIKIRRNI